MDEILTVVLGLGCLLAAVTVIGHGIWVVIAALFNSVTGGGPSPAGVLNRKPCPNCGAAYGLLDNKCTICGAVPHLAPRPVLRDDLLATARQLKRMQGHGALSLEEYERLAGVVASDLRRLGGGGTIPNATQPASSSPIPTLVPSAFEAPVTTSADAIDAELIGDAVPLSSQLAPPVSSPPPVSPFAPAAPRAQPPADRGLAASVPPQATAPRPLPPEPIAPRPTLADMLQSFLEESNIRWGEILAGFLIVISAVGLVISLRATLEKIPYFPALLFTSFTVAFHGAGLYTLRRWNLHAVSRVVLIISLLLVPLTASAAVLMSGSTPAQQSLGSPLLFWIVLLIGTAALSWVTITSSHELVGPAKWGLSIAVIGCSLAEVAVQRTNVTAHDFQRLTALAAFPLSCFLIAIVAHLVRARGWKQISLARANQTLLVLGVATFALTVALVMLLLKAEPRWLAVARLSPALSLAAGAVMGMGMLLHRRVTARSLATLQTAGTAILIVGGLLLLATVALAWPEPQLLFAVGLVNALLLFALALGARLPLLHSGAIACLALAWLMGLHLLQGRFIDIPAEQLGLRIVEAALMGRSSLALLLLGLLTAGAAALCWKRRWSDEALVLFASAGGLAVVGMLVALFAGFVPIEGWSQDADLGAPLLLLYATALLVAAPFTPWPWVAAGGALLLFAGLLQALRFNETCQAWLKDLELLPKRRVLAAIVGHALLSGVLALGIGGRRIFAGAGRFIAEQQTALQKQLALPLAMGGVVSLVAAVPLILTVRGGEFADLAIYALIAAAAWGALVFAQRWPWALSGMQAMLALSPALWVAGVWHDRLGPTDWVRSVQHVAAQLLVLALGTIVWSISRRLTRDNAALRPLLNPPWPAVDQGLLAFATIAAAVFAWCVAIPDIAYELGFESIGELLIANPTPVLGKGTRTALVAAAVLLALLASLWERVRLFALMGLGIATFALVASGAAFGGATIAVASTARWWGALYVAVWGLAYLARKPIALGTRLIRWLEWQRIDRPAARIWFACQPLVLGGLPILLLTLLAVSQSYLHVELRGPRDDSIFARIGPTAAYATPLLVIVGLLLGYAVRDRRAEYALGGSAVFQLAANLAFVLHVTYSPEQPRNVRLAEWLQWNALAAGVYALVWLGLRRWMAPVEAGETPTAAVERRLQIATEMLKFQIALAGAASLAIVLWGATCVAAWPARSLAETGVLGGVLSYLELAVVCAAAVVFSRGDVRGRIGDLVVWLATGMVALAAASIDSRDLARDWWGYHTLIGGWLGIGLVASAIVCWRVRGTGKSSAAWSNLFPHHASAAVLCGLLIALAIRGNYADPGQPWWSLAACVGVLVMTAGLGLFRGSQRYAYAATAAAGLALILFWIAPAAQRWTTQLGDDIIFYELWPLLLLAVAGFWLAVEIRSQRRVQQSFDPTFAGPRVHAAVALGLLPLYLLWRFGAAFFANGFPNFGYYEIAAATAVAAWALFLLGALWDRRALYVPPTMFVWLTVAWLLALAYLGERLPRVGDRVAFMTIGLAAQVAIAGQLWAYGANLSLIGLRLGVSDPVSGLKRIERWLPGAFVLLSVVACVLPLLLVLSLPRADMRTAVAFAPALAGWGLACLVQEERRRGLRLVALLLAGLSAIYLAWAQVGIDLSGPVWLTRVFRLLMVLAVLTFVYGLALPRWLLTGGPWNDATRKAGYLAGIAAVAAFVGVLALEVSLFQPGIGVDVDGPQIAAIAVVLLVLIAGLLSLALLPGRDPLVLSERGRQGYVYAALATGALLFAHLYICRPMWFDTALRPYWPLIVMAIAFAGAGGGEVFARFRLRVLAEPLTRFGALLPLLPVLGMWVIGAQTDYALLLFVVGVLYLMLSVTQKSWTALLAAAVAGNGALWTLLHDGGLALTSNPQLWIIPPALSLLLAAQLNRKRLPPAALASIRYGCTMAIYVSSTSEIFLRGVATSLWPAMILATLALIGAFLGMMLRIRAFLYLGAAFTLVSMITMVAHAAQTIDHVWPWWAFGVGMGIAILVLFGVFEKKRAEMLRLIARLREWEQ